MSKIKLSNGTLTIKFMEDVDNPNKQKMQIIPEFDTEQSSRTYEVQSYDQVLAVLETWIDAIAES